MLNHYYRLSMPPESASNCKSTSPQREENMGGDSTKYNEDLVIISTAQPLSVSLNSLYYYLSRRP